MQHGTSPLRAGWERMPSQFCVPRRRYLSTFTFFALGSVGAALHMFRARTSVPAVQPVHSTLRRTAILNIAGLAAGPILPASALVGSTLSPEIEEKVKLDGGGIADFTKTPDGLRILDLASGKGDECCAQDDIVVVDWSLRRSNGYFVDASFGFDPGRGIDEKFGVGSPELRFSPIGDKGDKVIEGIKKALIGMRVGGTRRVIVPPNLGFVSDDLAPKPNDWGRQRQIDRFKKKDWVIELRLKALRK
ncbi:FKBP16-1 [Symbiodinium sp. KB8]|nr:FKBP16-1 [Symbiodinium sp. KB8]